MPRSPLKRGRSQSGSPPPSLAGAGAGSKGKESSERSGQSKGRRPVIKFGRMGSDPNRKRFRRRNRQALAEDMEVDFETSDEVNAKSLFFCSNFEGSKNKIEKLGRRKQIDGKK